MTNMKALDMPAASGVPTTAILVGDYSNGNDALLGACLGCNSRKHKWPVGDFLVEQ